MHLTVGRLEVNSPVCFSDFVLFSGIDAFSYWLLKLSLIVIELDLSGFSHPDVAFEVSHHTMHILFSK